MSKESEDSALLASRLFMLLSLKLDDWKFLVGYWIFNSQVSLPHYPSALGAAASLQLHIQATDLRIPDTPRHR